MRTLTTELTGLWKWSGRWTVFLGLSLFYLPALSQRAGGEDTSFEPLKTWTLRHQFPVQPPLPLNGLGGVAFGNHLFVVVGNNGTILTSTNGENWGQQPKITASYLFSVAYGNGRFVAVGSSGAVLSSSNGTNWTTHAIGTASNLTGVQFVNGGFLAFSSRSLHTSGDGLSWVTIPIPLDLSSVAYGKGAYVAVTPLGTVATSADLFNWAVHSTGLNKRLNRIVFTDGQFYAVGAGGLIGASRDGLTWEPLVSGVTDDLYGIAVGAGTYVAVGGYASLTSNLSLVLSSTNGISWTRNSSATEWTLVDVAYGEGKFVAVANRPGPAQSSQIVLSEDGKRWRLSGVVPALRAIAARPDLLIAVGDNGTILASPDGREWSPRPGPTTAHLTDICHGNERFVAVGAKGVILTSTNGVNWLEQTSGTSIDLKGVKFVKDVFVAVGGVKSFAGANQAVIQTSTDAVQWRPAQGELGGPLMDVAFGSGILIGVGSMEVKPFPTGGYIEYMVQSTNALSWSRFPTSATPTPHTRIEYGNGRFVAITALDYAGTLTNVTRLSEWTQWWTGNNAPFSGLGFGRDTFLILGTGVIFASADGLTWQRQPTGNSATLNDVVFAQHSFVAVGENGTILESGPFPADIAVHLTNATARNGLFQVSVQTENGREYVLEFKNALEEPAWTPLIPVMGNGSTLQLSDTNTLTRQRFYRVRIH